MDAPDDPELASRVCLAVMRVGTRMAVGFDRRFAPLGLTQAQFRLLIGVWNCGGREGATPTALAEYLFIERASVSVMVKRLLAEGLLARLPERDRRSYRVVLTEKSGALLTVVGARAQALADDTLAGFPAAELKAFEGALKRLEERLRADASSST